MKHKQNGSIHVILLSIVVVLIGGVLGYTLVKNIVGKSNAASEKSSTSASATPSSSTSTPATASPTTASPVEIDNNPQNLPYVKFEDWKVQFPSATTYKLKRNSGTGNMAAYFISIDSLAQTCTTPDQPWLGIISQYTPSDVVENGPDTGKTLDQVFGKQGMTVNGKLYVFNVTTQFCTRNKSNPAVEQAAEKLKSEIQNLEAY